MGLADMITRGLRGTELHGLVRMPSLLVVRDLEAYHTLRTQLSPRKSLVMHSPAILHTTGVSTLKIGKHDVEGYLIEGDILGHSLAGIYAQQQADAPQIERTLASLDEAVVRTAQERSENMAVLAETARRLCAERHDGRQDLQDQTALRELIHSIVTTQFEHPQYFIREAVQNADGASREKAKNRIDIYLDSEQHLVRVEDRGRGMTPEVMDGVFFNLYASLNEALDHAAGKFGIGAVSFFGLGHEYVMVDSLPRAGEGERVGEGGRIVVDVDLNRDERFTPSHRTEPGTTLEIKLKSDADIDFNRIVQILRRDCAYIETPLYLHTGGTTEQLNRELTPSASSHSISFEEPSVQGHVVPAQEGELALLSHRIRLQSVPTQGYSGVVNCSGLDTTFSRDTVADDPVLRNVLRYVQGQVAKLKTTQRVGLDQLSLDTRLRAYRTFVEQSLFLPDGSPNEPWIQENIRELSEGEHWYPSLVQRSWDGSIFASKLASLATHGLDLITLPLEALRSKTEQQSFFSSLKQAWRCYRDDGPSYNNLDTVCLIGFFGVVGPVAQGVGFGLIYECAPSLRSSPLFDIAPISIGSSVLYGVLTLAEVASRWISRNTKHVLRKHAVNRAYDRIASTDFTADDQSVQTIGRDAPSRALRYARYAISAAGVAGALALTGYALDTGLVEYSSTSDVFRTRAKTPESHVVLPSDDEISIDPTKGSAQSPSSSDSVPPGTQDPSHQNRNLALLGGLVALLAAGEVLARRSRSRKEYRRITAHSEGSLSDDAQHYLSQVAEEFEHLPASQRPSVYVGGNLRFTDKTFYAVPGKKDQKPVVVLNAHRMHQTRPELVVLGYVTQVLRDPELAQTFIARTYQKPAPQQTQTPGPLRGNRT